MGREGVAGARFAASQINASGGIGGRLLELRVMAAYDSRIARPNIAAAESLSQDPSIVAVIGHSNSSASLSASQIYNERGVVQIAPTSSAPRLTGIGRFTFRLVASDIHQARFIADEITANGRKPRTAVFFVNDDYGRALQQEFRARLLDRNVPLVSETPYAEDDSLSDPHGTAQDIARTRPAILVWLGRAPHLLQLLPALRQTMPSLRILASDGIDGLAIETNPTGAFVGVQYASFLDLDSTRTALVKLRPRFLTATGIQVTGEAALTYDAVMLVATSMRVVGPKRDAIREYLSSLGHRRAPYAGVTGDITFDADGQPRPAYYLTEITTRGMRSIRSASTP